MDFPVFLNKWIISNKFLEYTIFWYWYRLVNHSGWRMDDHQRYADFWLNLNHGYDYMTYVHKFEEFWGRGSYPPETIYLSAEDFDALVKRLELPSESTMESIKRLMNRKAPWDND